MQDVPVGKRNPLYRSTIKFNQRFSACRGIETLMLPEGGDRDHSKMMKGADRAKG
jgi:hypothetical protein